ncbi:DUF397 domain-containing protein [Saccharothrix coeruleofusca]|uniref:DUF397 domain-containing protein n=1 Tax=Saccharothrix coeruleofusca TaxID=33919 RepID=A0A918AT55_9PSEU|nr:DUF397 domain-containing protein [Saccharothrix coeruleofusca]GGP80606.1 hypothetical protein GCM10010185_63110 [Saccharothrix coeruleofusca]
MFGEWRKSSRSGGSNQCVECSAAPGIWGVRDSKVPGGPVVIVTSGAFARMVDAVKRGRLDAPEG